MSEQEVGLNVGEASFAGKKSRLDRIAVGSVIPNKISLRGPQLEDPKFVELMHSIKQVGVMKPILVADNKDGTFTLIDGLQRWTAQSKIHADNPGNSNYAFINANIIDANTDDELTLQITLNSAVVRTKPVEFSKALQRLMASKNYSMDELAAAVSMSIPSLTNILRLGNLAENIHELVNSGQIKVTNAYVLAKLPEDEQQMFLEDAMLLSPTDFTPKIDSKLKELRAAKNNLPEPTGPEPKLRKLTDVKARHAELSELLKSEPDDKELQGRVAELAYLIQIDPESVQVWKAEKDKRAQEKAQAEVKRQEEAAAKAKVLADAARAKVAS